MSSWAVAVRAMRAAVGCWICISWSKTLPSLVILIWPAPPTSILSVPRGPEWARGRRGVRTRGGGWVGGWAGRTEVGFEDVLQALGGRAIDQQGLLLGDDLRAGVHETRGGGHGGSSLCVGCGVGGVGGWNAGAEASKRRKKSDEGSGEARPQKRGGKEAATPAETTTRGTSLPLVKRSTPGSRAVQAWRGNPSPRAPKKQRRSFFYHKPYSLATGPQD